MNKNKYEVYKCSSQGLNKFTVYKNDHMFRSFLKRSMAIKYVKECMKDMEVGVPKLVYSTEENISLKKWIWNNEETIMMIGFVIFIVGIILSS